MGWPATEIILCGPAPNLSAPAEKTLRDLCSDAASALEVGKAAEHLVVADLILRGYRCYLTDQGLPYDAVIDVGGRLVRVQVKSVGFPRDVNTKGRNPRIAYSFSVRRRGKFSSKRLYDSDCDIVALVALDIRTVGYIPIEFCGQTVQLSRPGEPVTVKFRGKFNLSRPIDSLPIGPALERDRDFYRPRGETLTHCPYGHEFTHANTYTDKRGARSCKTCAALRARRARNIGKSTREAAQHALPV